MKNPILVVSLAVLFCFALSSKVQAQQGVTEEDAKIISDKVLKIFNEGDTALIAEVYAPEAVVHFSAFPEDIIGHEGIKNWVESTRVQFPDLHMTFDESIVKGDKAVAIWTITGTNTGPMGKLPPTGKKFRITGVSVVYVQNGKVIKEIAVYNVLEMMMQLGFTLSPPQAAK